MASNTPLILASGALGVLTHLAYFNRGEHHMQAPMYIQIFVVAVITALGLLVRVADYSLSQASALVFPAAGIYLAGNLASLLVWRAFFSPLCKFPGPFGARLSNLWFSVQSSKADSHLVLQKLHAQYGQFLRIGSNDMSITHPDGPNAIYGHGTKCTKSYWYDNDQPFTSMHTSRDRQLHDKRRRIWSPAFSDKALRGYEDRLRPYEDKLAQQIKAYGGKPIDMAAWFNFFSFDVMGDLAFGESFDCLEKGEEHWAIQLLNAGMEPLHWHFPSWLFRIIVRIPGAGKEYWAFIKYCSDQLDRRIKKGVTIPDIMSSLLQPYKEKIPDSKSQEMTYLQGDSRLIIVAGSDTTAVTLTHLFLHLAREPHVIQKIREEIGPYVDAEGNVNHTDVLHADYLNGVINETLRLHPPVPSAVHRKTPPEGIEIAGTFVPGEMDVWCPQYVIGRDEKCYKHAQEFIPERWSTKPELVTNRTAFAPFSAGVYGCIGRPLALLEIRTVVAKLVTQFDVKFAPNEDGKSLEFESRDHFTLGMTRLMLQLEPRQKA